MQNFIMNFLNIDGEQMFQQFAMWQAFKQIFLQFIMSPNFITNYWFIMACLMFQQFEMWQSFQKKNLFICGMTKFEKKYFGNLESLKFWTNFFIIVDATNFL
jgi:hypothetical protein